MTDYSIGDAFADLLPEYIKTKHVCTVCEREIYTGEACYCFEGECVCENCCNEYVMDHYWYATPEDI
ncbi:MAG: hypothetical protein IJD83_03800 [Clostridia bacterium]|nr:hypothetical protein [Clostridia bacterium]